MPTSLIAPIVGSAASFGLSKLFGGNGTTPPQVAMQPQGFNAGGLSVSGGGDVTPSGARTDLVGNIGNLYSQQGDILGGLRQSVAPGFNDLLQARLNDLNNQASSAIGNLRENLSSRRVLGSSFAQDTLTRANKEFSNQRDSVIADSFLKSLAVNQQLTQQEFDARRNQFQTSLNELNLEADKGQAISTNANSILAGNARLQAQLDLQAAQNAGQFYGNLIQPVSKAIGSAAGNFFGGGSSGGGSGVSFGKF